MFIYLMIYNSDGDTHIRVMPKEELLEELNDEDSYYKNIEFLSEITESDTNYWGENTMLLLKAEIIVPEKKEVVTRYEIS